MFCAIYQLTGHPFGNSPGEVVESFPQFEHMDNSNTPEPSKAKCDQFRQWLIEFDEADEWWLCLDNVMEQAPLSLSEIEERLEAGQYMKALILHASQAGKKDPVWSEIPLHSNQDTLPETIQNQPPASPSEEPPKAERKPRLLKDFMEKMTPPQTGAEGDQAKRTKENKDTVIGCGLLVALCLIPILLWFYWRPLFRTGGFAIPCAAVIFYAIRAKKLNGCMVTLALLLGAIGYGIIDSLVGVVSASDLKNPPVAIEKIVRNALPKTENIIVDEGGGENSGAYSVIITYHATSGLSDKSTFDFIRLGMEDAYKAILKHKEPKIYYLKIHAQLEMQDKFGNQGGWVNVYSTSLNKETIQKLNRDNLRAVTFKDIWEEVFVHPIFFEFMKRN